MNPPEPDNIHAPYVKQLADALAWPSLVRYWIAHQHEVALCAAIEVLRGPFFSGLSAFSTVASCLEALHQGHAEVEFQASANELQLLSHFLNSCEQDTLYLALLSQRAAACETGRRAPIATQKATLESGLSAAREGAELSRTLKDEAAEAFFTSISARGSWELGDKLQAARDYEKAVVLYERLVSRRPEVYDHFLAHILHCLGVVQQKLHLLVSARLSFERSLSIRVQSARLSAGPHRRFEAETINALGAVLRDLNEIAEARISFQKSLNILHELSSTTVTDFRHLEAMILSNLATVEGDLCELEAAANHLETALSIYQSLTREHRTEFLPDVARTMLNLGTIYLSLSKFVESLKNLENAYLTYGDLAAYQPKIYREFLALALNNMGAVHKGSSERLTALGEYKEALCVYRELDEEVPGLFRRQLIQTLNNLANLLGDEGQRTEAKDNYNEALRLCREGAQHESEVYQSETAITLSNLGRLQEDLDDLTGAEASFKEAIQLLDAGAERLPTAHLVERMTCWSNLGNLYRRESPTHGWPDYLKAREAFRFARQSFEQFRSRFAHPDQRKRVLREAGYIFERLLQTCVNLWDVKSEGLHYLQEAVEVAEAGRSRHLLDLLAYETLNPRFTPPHLVEAFRELRRRVHQIERRLTEEDSDGPASSVGSEDGMKMTRLTTERPDAFAMPPPSRMDDDGAQLAKLLTERTEVNRQHESLLQQIRIHDPEFDPDQPVVSVSFDQVRALLPDDMPTAIVQFTLTREKGLALVIAGNDILKVPLPDFADRKGWEVADQWLRLYYEGHERSGASWMLHWEQALSTLLGSVAAKAIQPVLDRIHGIGLRRLIVVPHRALHLFPFHACPLTDGSLLMDRLEIVYAPSLSLLHRCAERPRTSREQLLLVQNPTGDLMYSEVEGQAIQRLYGSFCQTLEHGHATKERIFELDETAHVEHYTGHSFFNPKEPLKSALVLEALSEHGSSRWLQLRDAFTQLDLRHNRLTILNGCESGMLLPDPVDEYVNLPTGFLYAGAACVISTLWPVWDLSSALLMVRFHQIWKEDGRSDRIAAALRQAQDWLRREIRSGPHLRDEVLPAFLESVEDEVLRQKCIAAADDYARRFPDRPPFAHPIYWAPFIASGLAYPLTDNIRWTHM